MLTQEQKKDKRRIYDRIYRDANRDRKRAYWRKSSALAKKKNPDAYRKKQRLCRHKLRIQILELLGGAHCARCGFADWRALQIDHIRSDGAVDRKGEFKVTSSLIWKLRKWIMANPILSREKYQVLCANCNWIKREEKKEYPNVRTH